MLREEGVQAIRSTKDQLITTANTVLLQANLSIDSLQKSLVAPLVLIIIAIAFSIGWFVREIFTSTQAVILFVICLFLGTLLIKEKTNNNVQVIVRFEDGNTLILNCDPNTKVRSLQEFLNLQRGIPDT